MQKLRVPDASGLDGVASARDCWFSGNCSSDAIETVAVTAGASAAVFVLQAPQTVPSAAIAAETTHCGQNVWNGRFHSTRP